ncbi:response regulator [Clostridium ljungdahlii]|uniref:Stage 0 sporulation protein A homolog n=1 Tax=Clostridium ljungdahlii TaxID=1538 RepID=A0A170NIY3_9CLOT|nr:response regulator [Clostridium ljungdahlii]OAA90200.1 Sensor histidine kinase RcsC [Clostridium ljungdahlii]
MPGIHELKNVGRAGYQELLIENYVEDIMKVMFGAYDGFSALDILKDRAVDIVIIDIMMPNMDGYQLIKK